MSTLQLKSSRNKEQANSSWFAIINITPDSFSDGGFNFKFEDALSHIDEIITHNPQVILDIGGESTRPGSTPLSVKQECERIIPIIQAVRRLYPDTLISVDTWKSEVAEIALQAGAHIINDIYGCQGDLQMAQVVARYDAQIIAMSNMTHMYPKGSDGKKFPKRPGLTPVSLHLKQLFSKLKVSDQISYLSKKACTSLAKDPAVIEAWQLSETALATRLAELPRFVIAHKLYLAESLRLLALAGVKRDACTLDPGFGFGMSQEQNIALSQNPAWLNELRNIGGNTYPLLIGISRKRFTRPLATRLQEEFALDEKTALEWATAYLQADITKTNNIKYWRVHDTMTQTQLKEQANSRCYLSLGANLGDSKATIERAITLLKHDSRITNLRCASFYETEPWGLKEQPNFINTAVELNFSGTPQELLSLTQAIEQELGRVRTIHWGPRTIDIDIIFFGELVVDEENLKIPHPYHQERDFVLLPIEELKTGVIKTTSEVKLLK